MRLRIGTGAEIETALCILESAALYPTCKVSPRGRPETRNLGIWHLGSLRVGPERAPETRKLGIWNLGVPWAWTLQEGASETRKLGIWNMGVPLTEDVRRGGLGNSETRNLEFGGPLGSDPRGGLGNSETRNLEFVCPSRPDPRGGYRRPVSGTRHGGESTRAWIARATRK